MRNAVLAITTFVSLLYPQNYNITFIGLNAMTIKMELTDSTSHFDTQTTGIFDFIWPTANQYYTTFDQKSYGMRSYEKNVHQGANKYSVTAKYDVQDSVLIFNDVRLERGYNIQSIFTMLARIQYQGKDDLDTKWFSLEHEGILCKTRLLWADTATVTINDQSILSDHYRLDIKVIEDVTSIPERSDYFMKNIIQPNIIRQIWVEKNDKKRIIQAAVKIQGLHIIARIVNV